MTIGLKTSGNWVPFRRRKALRAEPADGIGNGLATRRRAGHARAVLSRHPDPTRRRFLQVTGLAAAGVWAGGGRFSASAAEGAAAGSGSGASVAALPVGAAPLPVVLPHFPSRLHAFVWRNWPLVPIERMAEVLGANVREVRRFGERMGLGRPPRIGEDQRRRSYLTVIRRNWHLIPYEQLLALLGWDAAEMDYALREDDFLWVKLGMLKPRCEPLRWRAAGPEEERAEGLMADLMEAELGRGFEGGWERMFQFVTDLSSSPSGSNRAPARGGTVDADSLRFCYSYFALYGDPLLDPNLDPYPDGYLARLAEAGVTGVWLQAVLYKMAPFPWQPELSEHYEKRLAGLTALVARARRHGIRVFLYLNEPRSMPSSFFAERGAPKGVAEGNLAAMCTSDPTVREFLSASVASIAKAVPDLGGFFTITASENLTNCWSHGAGKGCSRCGSRSPGEVIAEVIAAYRAGIERVGGRQRLIAWDWGWGDDWAPDAIARLPAEVSLMSVSEWSLPVERGGVKTTVGEYSLSAVGPGPRATRHWALARERGLKTVAKVQANNTWELSALPYLPVASLVAEHAGRLRELGLDGIMLSWTLGGYPSPNLETMATVMAGGDLAEVARRRFGPVLAPAVLRAWAGFAAAFREFPYHGGVVYTAPLQLGPANLLWPAKTGYSATMVGFPYDDLDAWRGPYPADVFVAQLTKVAAGFSRASTELAEVAGKSGSRGSRPGRSGSGSSNGGERSPTAAEWAALEQEAMLGEAAGIHFRSVANQARFVGLRRRWEQVGTGPDRSALLDELEPVVRDELNLARRLHALQSVDSRVGFEASNHYYYLPVDLGEKVLNCRYLLDRWLPEQRRRTPR